jgi:hypothetical protein
MDMMEIPSDIRVLLDRFKARAEEIAAQPQGEPMNPRDGEADCEHCEGRGWRQVNEGGYWRYRRCGCVVVTITADGVPYEFRDAALDNYREEDGNKSAVVKARQFLDGTRDLYLAGGVGAGKTRLACSILNEHARKRRTAFFARVPMLLHQLQPGRDAGDLEQRLFTTSLLVLDDVGAERDQATDYTRRTLLMIYEERGDRGVRTIFTSNKALGELGAMQDDDRLASRIAGRADVVKLSTGDQRLRRVK